MDLWTLTQTSTKLDPGELAAAIERQSQCPDPDYRTRLLTKDAALALRDFWGETRFGEWLSTAQGRENIRCWTEETCSEVGFPSLAKRIQVSTRAETIRQYLRELGSRLTSPVEIVVGGSSSLILAGLLQRHTEDIDLVDEVPRPLRELNLELAQLQSRYGLVVAHFQSHYLPPGWSGRLTSEGGFRRLQVKCVDPLDVAVGKLMSRREKDLDDLRVLVAHFTREQIVERLSECKSHLQDKRIGENIEHNFYILFGEEPPAL